MGASGAACRSLRGDGGFCRSGKRAAPGICLGGRDGRRGLGLLLAVPAMAALGGRGLAAGLIDAGAAFPGVFSGAAVPGHSVPHQRHLRAGAWRGHLLYRLLFHHGRQRHGRGQRCGDVQDRRGPGRGHRAGSGFAGAAVRGVRAVCREEKGRAMR